MFKESSTLYNFSHFIVVVVGFVDTLVKVNEADGQATLNVSIISPLPMPGVRGLGIMFSLRVDSMDGSAGRDRIPQCCECVPLCTLITRLSIVEAWNKSSVYYCTLFCTFLMQHHTQPLTLCGILYLGLRTFHGLLIASITHFRRYHLTS